MYRNLRLSYRWTCMKHEIAWYVERFWTYRMVKEEYQTMTSGTPLRLPYGNGSKFPWISSPIFQERLRDLIPYGLLSTTWPRVPIFLPFRRVLRLINWPMCMYARLLLTIVYQFLSYLTMMRNSFLSFCSSFMRIRV